MGRQKNLVKNLSTHDHKEEELSTQTLLLLKQNFRNVQIGPGGAATDR